MERTLRIPNEIRVAEDIAHNRNCIQELSAMEYAKKDMHTGLDRNRRNVHVSSVVILHYIRRNRQAVMLYDEQLARRLVGRRGLTAKPPTILNGHRNHHETCGHCVTMRNQVSGLKE